jgi:LysM repeat protein
MIAMPIVKRLLTRARADLLIESAGGFVPWRLSVSYKRAMPGPRRRALSLLIGIALTLMLLAGQGAAAQTTCSGRLYRIQRGDSWSNLAQRTGLPVTVLKAANPAAASQPQGWLIVGQTLCLPAGAAVTPAEAERLAGPAAFPVTVRRGDSWAVLAGRYGVSVAALQAANPGAVRAGQVLRPGDRILIPITRAMTEAFDCGSDLPATAGTAAQVLTEWSGSVEVLQSYLVRCGALDGERGTVQTAWLRGGSEPEVVIALVDPQAGDGGWLGMLAVLGSGPLGWEVIYLSGLAADVELLALEDVNDDGHPDIVWSDTTCSASACFSTVHVSSYVDGDFRSWVNGSTTMASAAIRLEDVMPQGSGQELLIQGGVIGAVAAGPQRPVETTWASLAGGPYVLVQQRYAPSFCLYHHILEADTAMRSGAHDGYAAASAAYRAAADDPRLVACWIRPNEVEELRAYALYRLAVAHAYAGDRAAADTAVEELGSSYPDDPLAKLARLWWLSYRATRDDAAACAVATTFAVRQPGTWQRLADYGFANPGFTAETLCPLEDETAP